MSDAATLPRMSQGAKVCRQVLADVPPGADGLRYIGRKGLAKRLERGVRQVSRYVAELAAHGITQVSAPPVVSTPDGYRTRGVNGYRLLLEADGTKRRRRPPRKPWPKLRRPRLLHDRGDINGTSPLLRRGRGAPVGDPVPSTSPDGMLTPSELARRAREAKEQLRRARRGPPD